MSKRNRLLVLAVWFALFSADLPERYFNSISLNPDDSEEEIIWKSAHIVPTENQLRWQKLEYIAFLHFGLNTFTNKEWGNGREDPRLFNPSQLDTRQWARALKEAGFKQAILTAKHHDGFCLWQTQYTDYSVKSSPWKNGKGDVVKEFADACREYGLKVGIYLSPWDRHEKTYGTPAYNDFYRNQLQELLSNYGEISEVWFDGAGIGKKWKKMQKLYDWEGFIRIVRELQPNAVIFQGGDIRWVGNEAGKNRPSEWSVVPEKYIATEEDLGSRAKLLQAAKQNQIIRWLPAEVDTSIRLGWFYHPQEDLLIKPLSHLIDIYFNAVGGNAVLLLNIPPDRRGLLPERDVERLLQLKKYLDQTFARNFAENAKISISTDGRIIEYHLTEPVSFNLALIQEDITKGQRVEEFILEIWQENSYQQIAQATTIGYKKILRFPETRSSKIRLRITQCRLTPFISNFGLYLAPKEP